MKVKSTTTNKTFVAFTDQVRFGAHSELNGTRCGTLRKVPTSEVAHKQEHWV